MTAGAEDTVKRRERNSIQRSLLCLKLYCVCCSLLFLKVKAHNDREQFAFCSVKGCERVKITAIIPKGSPPSNCMAQAYPKHAELPVVDVPMPRKIPNARLVRNDEGSEFISNISTGASFTDIFSETDTVLACSGKTHPTDWFYCIILSPDILHLSWYFSWTYWMFLYIFISWVFLLFFFAFIFYILCKCCHSHSIPYMLYIYIYIFMHIFIFLSNTFHCSCQL